MRISIDFGITVTDSLKKTSNGSLEHKMVLSNSEPSENLVRTMFPEFNFNEDLGLIAVTGGKRLEQEQGFPVLECNIHEARPEEELQAARYGCGEDHEKWTP